MSAVLLFGMGVLLAMWHAEPVSGLAAATLAVTRAEARLERMTLRIAQLDAQYRSKVQLIHLQAEKLERQFDRAYHERLTCLRTNIGGKPTRHDALRVVA